MAVKKVYQSIMAGTQDKSIHFKDLQSVLEALGFICRIKGDHFIYTCDGIPEIINIQPNKGMAKPYQVKQIRNLILKYKLEV